MKMKMTIRKVHRKNNTGVLFLICTFIFLTLVNSVSAQQYEFTEDTFSELTLDVSSVDDVINKLGTPSENKANSTIKFLAGTQWFKGWFTRYTGKKSFRKLVYKNSPDFDETTLYFLEDKLVLISVRLKSPFIKDRSFLSPNSLDSMFDVNFKTFRWAFGRKLPAFKDFENFEGHKIEKNVPYYYLRIGTSERSIVANLVDNNNENYIGSPVDKILSSTAKKRDEMNSVGDFPGYVATVHLVSRRLIN